MFTEWQLLKTSSLSGSKISGGAEGIQRKTFNGKKKKKKCFHDNLPGFCNRFGRRMGGIFETSIKSNLKKITVPPQPSFSWVSFQELWQQKLFLASVLVLKLSLLLQFLFYFFITQVENLVCHICRSSTVSFLIRCPDEKLDWSHIPI